MRENAFFFLFGFFMSMYISFKVGNIASEGSEELENMQMDPEKDEDIIPVSFVQIKCEFKYSVNFATTSY